MIRFGFSEVDITPERPMELVGFYRADNKSKKNLAQKTADGHLLWNATKVKIATTSKTRTVTTSTVERMMLP